MLRLLAKGLNFLTTFLGICSTLQQIEIRFNDGKRCSQIVRKVAKQVIQKFRPFLQAGYFELLAFGFFLERYITVDSHIAKNLAVFIAEGAEINQNRNLSAILMMMQQFTMKMCRFGKLLIKILTI